MANVNVCILSAHSMCGQSSNGFLLLSDSGYFLSLKDGRPVLTVLNLLVLPHKTMCIIRKDSIVPWRRLHKRFC